MPHHFVERLEQHSLHRQPAGDNHGDDNQHHGGQQPDYLLVITLIVLHPGSGQRRLRATPFPINFLHGRLLLLGILLEHLFQLTFSQQRVHFSQRRRIDAVLLFQSIGQMFIKPRRFRQGVVFIVMLFRFGQQAICRVHQFLQLTAVNLAGHRSL